MKIKSRNEILNDIIREGKKNPKDWKAVLGEDKKLLSKDYYIFNQKTGIYLMKEYNKNPFEVKGIGSKIARKVDENVEAEISKYASDFGIIQGDYKKIIKNLERGISPEKIFDAALNGKKDYGVKIPIKGTASNSKDAFSNIHNNYSKNQKKLDKKFEEIADEDGLYRSYD